MKILLLNNYPLARVYKEVELGETPDQLLFGYNHFIKEGHDCITIGDNLETRLSPFYRILKKLNWLFPLGDIEQQFAALNIAKNFDIIYCPATTHIYWLQYLRNTGRLKIPILSINHHKIPDGRLNFARKAYFKKLFNNTDANLTLSKYVADDINSRWNPANKAKEIQWGADLSFYDYNKGEGKGIIVAGRTSRDFSTVIQALNISNSHGKIIYLKGHLGYDGPISNNVNLFESSNEQPVPGKEIGWKKVKDIIPLYQEARVIGIPLYTQDSLAGLTSLMDCLGAGKPVIMTRNPNIDLDIEKEGIGIWVEPGDIQGWKEAINWYEANPEQARRMGEKARKLAEDHYNTARFGEDLLGLFKSLISKKTA